MWGDLACLLNTRRGLRHNGMLCLQDWQAPPPCWVAAGGRVSLRLSVLTLSTCSPSPAFFWGLRHTALTFWLPDPSVGFLLYCGSALEGGGRVGRIAIKRPSEIMGSQASSRSWPHVALDCGPVTLLVQTLVSFLLYQVMDWVVCSCNLLRWWLEFLVHVVHRP